MSARKSKKLAGLVILSLALTAGTYAFAAANTVPASNAGDGNGAVSGYTVSNIAYDINTDSDPTDVDSVSFTLSANAGQVFAKLVASGSTYTSCTGGPLNWTCAMPAAGPTVVSVDDLRVIATS